MFLLLYRYVPDVVQRRVPHREAHLALIRRFHADGFLERAGALGDPPTAGAFVFSDERAIERFLAEDPYVDAGLVLEHESWPWNLVT